MVKKKVRQLDRFRVSLAIVDGIGIIAFLITFIPVILIYLLVFNIVVILVDTIRKGMSVRKPGETVVEEEPVELPDEMAVDPETGNLIEEPTHTNQPEERTAAAAPKWEPPKIKPVMEAKKEPSYEKREEKEKDGFRQKEDEVEDVLREWAS